MWFSIAPCSNVRGFPLESVSEGIGTRRLRYYRHTSRDSSGIKSNGKNVIYIRILDGKDLGKIRTNGWLF